MPYIPPFNFTNKQIKILQNLMLELRYSDINKLIRRALSVFNSLVKHSYGPEKKIYLIEADPDDINLSPDRQHYILDTSKVKLLAVPLLNQHKSR